MKISNQVEKNNNNNNCTAWCVLMKASVEATQIIKLQAENVMMPTVSWKLNGKETRMHFPQYLLPASANCTGTGREIHKPEASGKATVNYSGAEATSATPATTAATGFSMNDTHDHSLLHEYVSLFHFLLFCNPQLIPFKDWGAYPHMTIIYLF